VVWPREVVYAVIDLGVRVSSAFCTKLENCPVVLVLVIQELDKLIRRISVGFLWPDRARSRSYDDEVCNIA
jgi:hypothetical protein